MKPSELLKNIQTLLSAKIELAQELLLDGTVLEAESFEAKQPVFVVTEDGQIPAPVGEHKLESGKTLVIVEEGIIDSIVETETEVVEVEAAKEMEVEAAEEVVTEETEVEEKMPSQEEIIDAVVKVVAPMLEELKSELADIKMKYDEMSKTKMSKITHSPEAKNTVAKTTKKNNVLETIFDKLN
jgi:membrane-bound ClpP family serine protease